MLGAIRAYQVAISPLLPATCRFTPTCSQYALEAVSRHGAAHGGWLAIRRVLRCHPFGRVGYDPVPGEAEPTERERVEPSATPPAAGGGA